MGDEILEINGVPIVDQDQKEVASYMYNNIMPTHVHLAVKSSSLILFLYSQVSTNSPPL